MKMHVRDRERLECRAPAESDAHEEPNPTSHLLPVSGLLLRLFCCLHKQLWDMARDQHAGGADGGEQVQDAVIPASRAISIVGMLMASHQLPAGR